MNVRIPEKELLIAVKLHSGRLTDVRDVVALAEDVDVDTIQTHLCRGDTDRLQQALKTVVETLDAETFADAFKGVFAEQDLPEHRIETVRTFIQQQLRKRS